MYAYGIIFIHEYCFNREGMFRKWFRLERTYGRLKFI